MGLGISRNYEVTSLGNGDQIFTPIKRDSEIWGECTPMTSGFKCCVYQAPHNTKIKEVILQGEVRDIAPEFAQVLESHYIPKVKF